MKEEKGKLTPAKERYTFCHHDNTHRHDTVLYLEGQYNEQGKEEGKWVGWFEQTSTPIQYDCDCSSTGQRCKACKKRVLYDYVGFERKGETEMQKLTGEELRNEHRQGTWRQEYVGTVWRDWYLNTDAFLYRDDSENYNPLWMTWPRLKVEIDYRNGVPHGSWKEWDRRGRLLHQGSYENGKKVGLWKGWHCHTDLSYGGRYDDGKRVGPWKLRNTYHTYKGEMKIPDFIEKDFGPKDVSDWEKEEKRYYTERGYTVADVGRLYGIDSSIARLLTTVKDDLVTNPSQVLFLHFIDSPKRFEYFRTKADIDYYYSYKTKIIVVVPKEIAQKVAHERVFLSPIPILAAA